jgi:hypothetical protein
MYSHRRQNLIGRAGGPGGLPRRRVLQGAGALGLAAILRPTAVFAEWDDDNERLGPFGPWSSPVNLGPVVNSRFLESHPGISRDGLSLYITSDRPGGVNGENPNGFLELWVSRRASLDAAWVTPINLDAFNNVSVVNGIGSTAYAPNFSPDGHLMFFSSTRLGGCGGPGRSDMYVCRRANKYDDFAWQAPVNLGCVINSPQDDDAPIYFEDEETGIISLYFASTRPGGPIGSPPGSDHIYVSTLGDDGSFGPAVLVPELSSPYEETRTAIRRDGLEFFVTSKRPNGRIGVNDIWVSTRDNTIDPWSTPVNLGPTVNYPGFITGAPALSWDGTTLYCYSTRPGGFGGRDLYVSTRRKLREHERHDDSDHQRS